MKLAPDHVRYKTVASFLEDFQIGCEIFMGQESENLCVITALGEETFLARRICMTPNNTKKFKECQGYMLRQKGWKHGKHAPKPTPPPEEKEEWNPFDPTDTPAA